MIINKDIRCKDEAVNDYIQSLEDYCLAIGNSNVFKVATAIDRTLGKYAEHLDKRRENKPSKFDEEVLDDCYKALDKVEKLRKLDELFKSLVPNVAGKEVAKEEAEADENKVLSIVPQGNNAFEALKDKIKNKVNASK